MFSANVPTDMDYVPFFVRGRLTTSMDDKTEQIIIKKVLPLPVPS